MGSRDHTHPHCDGTPRVSWLLAHRQRKEKDTLSKKPLYAYVFIGVLMA